MTTSRNHCKLALHNPDRRRLMPKSTPDFTHQLVSDFRSGKISRRQFLGILAAMTGGAAVAATMPVAVQSTHSRGSLSMASPVNRLRRAITPQTLIYGAAQDIATIDPSDRTDYSILAMSRQIYDRLFRFEGGWPQPVEPGLALTHEVSDDAKQWTFHLTDKAKFHDGSPLTAEDVVY